MSKRTAPSLLQLDWLTVGQSEPDDKQLPEHQAADIASRIFYESLDMAQHVISHSPEDRRDVLALAAAYAEVTARVYVTNLQIAAMQSVLPESPPAFGASCPGSGVFGGIQQAFKKYDDNQNHA